MKYIINPKKVNFPFFSRFQKWVCRASQVRMDNGTSVENAVASVENAVAEIGQSGGGSCAPKVIALQGYGTLQESGSFRGHYAYDIIENPSGSDDNYISKEDADYIKSNNDVIVAIKRDGQYYFGYVLEAWTNQTFNITYWNIIPLSFSFYQASIRSSNNKFYIAFENPEATGK